MMDSLDKAKRYLWAFVELAFLLIIAIVLIYLILGPMAGTYVQSAALYKNLSYDIERDFIAVSQVLVQPLVTQQQVLPLLHHRLQQLHIL